MIELDPKYRQAIISDHQPENVAKKKAAFIIAIENASLLKLTFQNQLGEISHAERNTDSNDDL